MEEQHIGSRRFKDKMESLKLSDDVISNIAKLVQIAILTGTDIVDNLRTLRLTLDGDSLEVHKDFEKSLQQNIDNMLSAIPREDSTE